MATAAATKERPEASVEVKSVPIVWAPQPGPQAALVHCPYPEVLFGGARGGGKTDGILGKWGLKAVRKGSLMNAVFFRKEMPQQDDLIERSKEIYGKLGASWNEYRKTWRFGNGASVRFRPLENVSDAEKYQGQNLSDACVEEAGNYAESAAIDRLWGCLRGDEETQLILTANPGGAGHNWLKARYIEPAPFGMKRLTRKLPNGKEHHYVYIPSRVSDNKILMQNDPEYINRLYLVGSEQLVKAWLTGDWNVIEGAFFDCWNTEKHVVRPFRIPDHWYRQRSGDWGSAKPFSIGWWAVASETVQVQNVANTPIIVPKGTIVRYREWYGCEYDKDTGIVVPNTGLKLTAEQVAEGIKEREIHDKIRDGVLDPSAFIKNGGPSIAERMFTSHKIAFRPADNSRVAKRGAMGGWDMMRQRLIGTKIDGKEYAQLVVFSTCKDFIRTVPVLQHDKLRAEDLDTNGEDHVADEARYMCLSRPLVAKPPEGDKQIRGLEGLTLDELFKREEKRRVGGRRRI